MESKCKITGCTNGCYPINGKEYFTHGYCDQHRYRWEKYGDPNKIKKTSGEHRTSNPLYCIYNGMKRRCYNKNFKNYPIYGGRGIKICERWLGLTGFSNFIYDMGERPKGTSLDRINNDGDYEPSNCRWATQYTQVSNRRNSTGCSGVSYSKSRNKWRATIRVKGKPLNLGSFNQKEDAIKARREAKLIHLGYYV